MLKCHADAWSLRASHLSKALNGYEVKMNTKQLLQSAEKQLRIADRHQPFAVNWLSNFPHGGGVYVIWESGTPVYVGETSGVHSRMGDLMRPVNHAFTKKVGIENEISDLDLLRQYISDTYQISFIGVDFGRSEIEEYLILRWRKTLINKPTTRLLKGEQYTWVEAV